jgi:hypothetical protein
MELSKAHYQFIANQLDRIQWDSNKLLNFYESRRLLDFEAYESKENEFKIVSFINKLQSWNDHAWHTRYPHRSEDAGHDYDLVLRVNEVTPSLEPHQLLKALECVEYQCCDSDQYMKSKEREIVQTLIRDCLDHIVHQSAEYEAAVWGI